MTILDCLREKLKEHPEISWSESEDGMRMEAASPDGFPIDLLSHESGFTVVFGDGWHEEFSNEDEALECVAFGLSNESRLKVTSRGGSPYFWTLERREGDTWSFFSSTGLFFFRIWLAKEVAYFRNDFITRDQGFSHSTVGQDEKVQSVEEEPSVSRWIQVFVGLVLGVVILLCLFGSLAVVFDPSADSQGLSTAIGIVLFFGSLWALLLCFRLVFGLKAHGGLMGPFALRMVAWFFLLLPIGGLFTGYFQSHTFQAIVMTIVYIGGFFSLRNLASAREQRDA